MPTLPFSFRDLTESDLQAVMVLQEECISLLPDRQLYYPLTRDELLESLRLDKVMGVYAGSELVAIAVVVTNRLSDRNLATGTFCNPTTSFTFDAVIVSPQWRGYGLQRELIGRSIDLARACGARQILATVSPDNTHSLNNFKALGFEILSTSRKYSGLERHTVKLDIAP